MSSASRLTGLRGAERLLADLLATNGPSTRTELARLAELPVSTVTSATGRMLARGDLEEVPQIPGSLPRRGRPAARLRLSPRAHLTGVVVLTPRTIRTALVGDDGSVAGREEVAFDWLQCSDVVAECIQRLGAARRRSGLDAAIDHVVLGRPGPHQQGVGMPLLTPHPEPSGAASPPAAAWLLDDVQPALEEAFDAPATVENDANLAALGEAGFGVAAGLQHVVHLKLVTGMGAGVIVNGQLVRGAHGLAGQLSHLTVDLGGPLCACGSRGCLGKVATADQLLDSARSAFGLGIDMFDLLGLSAQGDHGVRRILEDLGELVGRHLAPFCVMLDPQMLVIDGTLGPAAAPVITGLRNGLRRSVPPVMSRSLQITTGTLGTDAELLGAARLTRV
ncbi:ROK family protein [Kineococcus sp. SYSU DK005]|uniref:ROK family protein n=1 Tax=Kineococcus sp. SYSU DK005 TaxID=3383126 RepID=UPI003D7E83EE